MRFRILVLLWLAMAKNIIYKHIIAKISGRRWYYEGDING